MCERHQPGRTPGSRCGLRRGRAASGHAFARAGRPVRTGLFAHRCGVSRCGQVFVLVEMSQESTWRGRGDE
ncbi:hypothetical protein E1295_00510 [Nonomuraea mesophila]|uniref:Uncharacterized protein n=1 Tax=Nonomuraea mesophila TaxID=2530382 RepID=A0A4R5FYS9_9ACTN|nr:hypothetical protein [Nonomuraea mesophila]TDE60359.1 hypothetical protein E1295_00510 [Nonomuraea mesophila]